MQKQVFKPIKFFPRLQETLSKKSWQGFIWKVTEPYILQDQPMAIFFAMIKQNTREFPMKLLSFIKEPSVLNSRPLKPNKFWGDFLKELFIRNLISNQ